MADESKEMGPRIEGGGQDSNGKHRKDKDKAGDTVGNMRGDK